MAGAQERAGRRRIRGEARAQADTGVTTLRVYQSSDAAGLVACWNKAFAGGPNFIPISETDLVRRLTGQTAFDAESLLLAERRGEIVGFTHWGPLTNFWYEPQERCADSMGGQIWQVVAGPGERALLGELLHAALARLTSVGARRILLYPSWVHCTQPFYNSVAGAYEYPGLSTAREDLLEEAAAQGFGLQAEYGTPELDLTDRAHMHRLREEAARAEARLRGSHLRVWLREVRSRFFSDRRAVDLVCGRERVATTAYGLWEEYARSHGRLLFGITGVQVAAPWRGRGLGKAVMVRALEAAAAAGAEAAHLHVYRANTVAWNLYHQALGFRSTYSWVTLEKPR